MKLNDKKFGKIFAEPSRTCQNQPNPEPYRTEPKFRSFPSAREISIGKNKEYEKEKIFYTDVLKTIHKKISNQKMKSKERDKSILEYVQCMYNNVHTYKVPGF